MIAATIVNQLHLAQFQVLRFNKLFLIQALIRVLLFHPVLAAFKPNSGGQLDQVVARTVLVLQVVIQQVK
jgi:hypothetical protein